VTTRAGPDALTDVPGHPSSSPDRATRPWRDALGWSLFSLVGLGLTALAVREGAQLGTASAPFLGRYRLQLGPASLLAPAVAAVVLLLAWRGWLDRVRWSFVVVWSYVAALAWALALAFVDGSAGLTRALTSPDEYLADLAAVGDDPLSFVAHFTERAGQLSVAARGHPPGPVLLLWALHRAGVRDDFTLGLLITALGALAVPLVLAAVSGTAGETAGRRYLPVLALAPYAVWTAVSLDAIVAVLGAAMINAGVHASAKERTGWRAAAWAGVAGLVAGTAALFSYAVPWLGLALVLLYFARRRPFLNLASGVAALVPVLAASYLLGFSWVRGLGVAHADWASRVEPYRSAVWWSGISLVALLLAAGPPLFASLRKVRNTPAWPFLIGAGLAVLFSVLAGLARGGVERAWLPFFPWLTVAAVAPERQAGPPVPAPLLLAGLGAVVAIVVEAVLATPW
jgi:methylthioxylose transferase